MSGLAFALVLTAAFLHAAWNFLLKRINAGPELVWLFSTLTLIIYLPVAAAVWVIEKPQFDLVSGGFVLGSAVLHLGYLLVLQQGYQRGDLSLVYPTARATGPFLSTIFAVIILGEALPPRSRWGRRPSSAECSFSPVVFAAVRDRSRHRFSSAWPPAL